MNKKGFELVWNNLVVMVIAIVLLISLLGFFAFSSGNFMSNIKGYFSYANVDSVVSGCNLLGGSGEGYAFCCEKKDVKYYVEGERSEGSFSCEELRGMEFYVVDFSCEEVNCGDEIV
ncbi:hypothetical protein HOD75_02390 [archaeon]|jgi:hypothetical protein|nr:hypothetical protein [archaeon]MBT4241727.1 hypothetical protein [archaeon]MBT4418275.1 hypothetical protein [archaeon]